MIYTLLFLNLRRHFVASRRATSAKGSSSKKEQADKQQKESGERGEETVRPAGNFVAEF